MTKTMRQHGGSSAAARTRPLAPVLALLLLLAGCGGQTATSGDDASEGATTGTGIGSGDAAEVPQGGGAFQTERRERGNVGY